MGVFSVFSDKNKRKKNKNTLTPTVEQYYEERAHRTAALRWILLLALMLFIIYGFAFHSEELTVDNFRYMLKFVEFTEKESTGVSLVTFDYGEENKGALYKGDVVVLNKTGLSIYSEDADRVLSSSFRMGDPRLAVSGTGVLAYDLGGNEVRMFNSFSQLALIPTDYPIYGLCVSESGNFAVITSEKNYRTSVYVYDQYAKQRYHRSLSTVFVDQAALSPDGEELLTLGHYAKNGSFYSVLERYSIHEEEPLESITYKNEMPLRLSWLDGDRYAVLTGEAVRIYRKTEKDPIAEYSLSEISLQNCLLFEKYILIISDAEGISGGTVLTVLDENLKKLSDTSFDGSIENVSVINGKIYALMIGSVTELSPDGREKKEYEVSNDVLSVLASAENEPLLFEKSRVLKLADAEADTEMSEEFFPLDEPEEQPTEEQKGEEPV